MTRKRNPEFKASQLYDWQSEPKEERGSSFFYNESTYDAPMPRVRPAKRGRLNSLSLAVIVAIMLGACGLVALSRVLQG